MGFARVAFDGGNLIYGDDREIDFETGLRSVRVGEVHRLDRDLASRADGSGDLLSEQFLLGFAFGLGHESLRL